MKFIKVLLIIILVLIVLMGVGAFIFIKTFDANQYKDKITQEMTKALNRPVNMDRIDLKMSAASGVSLEVVNLDIKDMLEVESTYLAVDLMQYAKNRKIVIPKAIVKSPKITFVQAGTGASGAAGSGSTSASGASTSGVQEIPEVSIETIRIENGTLHYRDITQAKPVDIKIQQLDVEIKDVALDKPFPYKVALAVFSDQQQTVKLDGLATYLSKSGEIRVQDLKVDVLLGKMSLAQILQAAPDLAGSGLQSIDGGTLILNLKELLLKSDGQLGDVSADGQLKDLKLRVEQLPGPVAMDADFQMTGTDVRIGQAVVKLADGEVKLSGNLTDVMQSMGYDLKLTINQVDVTKLMDQSELPVKIAGSAQGQFDVTGQGIDEAAIRSNLSGAGQFRIADGRIKDKNLLGIVVNQLAWFPDFSNRFKSNLSPKYQERIKADDTVLNDVSADVQIAAGQIQLKNVQLDADGFVYSASGRMDFDQNLNLKSSFSFDQELSDTMLKMQGELSALLDNSRRVNFPFKDYQGKADKYVPRPDTKELFKQGVANRGKAELKKVLFKALDMEEQSAPKVEGTLNTGVESNLSEPKEVSTEEVLIDNVLDAIPLFK